MNIDQLPIELIHLGENLATARSFRRQSQTELAETTSIPQATISQFENGKRIPNLEQLIRLAQALNVSVQWFFRGSNFPGTTWSDVAVQLRELGITDIHLGETIIPGAFLPNEQVLAICLSPTSPEPRIVEAMPAVLAWNKWDDAALINAYAEYYGEQTQRRLAWLTDITLTILRTSGLPQGCVSSYTLERFLSMVSLPNNDQHYDTMGRAADEAQLPPVSKRWKISYPAQLNDFVDRAVKLLTGWKQRRFGQRLTSDVPIWINRS